MDFKERLKNRRLEIGKTLEDVAKVVGVSKTTVQRWESGLIENLRRDKIAKLAQALNTTPAYLMGWDDAPEPSIFDIQGVEPLPEMVNIPLLGTIACGEPILAVENIDEYVPVEQAIRATFALRCKGDSMINARIYDGDVVYIRQQPDVENGQIAAVLIDNEATLKRVYKQAGVITLAPENPAFAPIVYTGEETKAVRILGLAVAFTSAIR